jgi:hypothetical protein
LIALRYTAFPAANTYIPQIANANYRRRLGAFNRVPVYELSQLRSRWRAFYLNPATATSTASKGNVATVIFRDYNRPSRTVATSLSANIKS